MRESAGFIQVFFNLALWFSIYIVLKPSYAYPYVVKESNKRLGLLLILLFCLYPFWGGDYFHYKEIFNDFVRNGILSGQEAIYEWIFRTFGLSYTLVRLVIWGLAIFILTWSYRRTYPNYALILFIFGLCYLPTFSYARVSLAMSLILLGLTFIVNHGKVSRFISIVCGAILLLSAALFHKSAPIGISMALVSLFLRDATKKKMAVVLLMIPIAVFALQYALNYFFFMELDADTYISDRTRSTYFEMDESGTDSLGIGELLGFFLQQGTGYLVALLYIIIAWTGKLNKFTETEKVISAYAFCITLLSVGFSFDLGYSLRVLQYRTLFFAFPADAVFLAAVHRHGFKKKLFRFIFYLTILGTAYQLLYATYLSLV